jgi:hypothetical protein
MTDPDLPALICELREKASRPCPRGKGGVERRLLAKGHRRRAQGIAGDRSPIRYLAAPAENIN